MSSFARRKDVLSRSERQHSPATPYLTFSAGRTVTRLLGKRQAPWHRRRGRMPRLHVLAALLERFPRLVDELRGGGVVAVELNQARPDLAGFGGRAGLNVPGGAIEGRAQHAAAIVGARGIPAKFIEQLTGELV